jgi:thiamine biosynthesis protein ThiI
MMAKRGVEVEALHFESFPYTSERAKEKVKSLASILCRYTDKMRFHCMSFTEIQLAIKDNCDEEYFTLLLRRFMMRLSQRCAKQFRCRALITGESIGQVASQTMMALGVTDAVVSMPVFRPCIGMDKEEIITIARKVHTFDTSVLPYEDCCTVFTPRHPKTCPTLEQILEQEAKLPVKELEEKAFSTLHSEYIKGD